VILNGQGADELLGGYPHDCQTLLGTALTSGRLGTAWKLVRSIHQSGFGAGDILKTVARTSLPSAIKEGIARNYLRRSAPWLNQDALTASLPGLVDHGPLNGSRSHLKSALKNGIHNGLQALLRYDDRNSMSHSVESRVPFVVPAMARLCLSFPDEFLISRSGVTKHIFREAMRGIVPDIILDRRDKIAFLPDNKSWKNAVTQLVGALPDDAAIGDFINSRRLKHAVAQSGKRESSYDFNIMWVATNMLMFDQNRRMAVAE